MIIFFLFLKGFIILSIIALVTGWIFEILPYLLHFALLGCRNILGIFILILILGLFAKYWKIMLIIFVSVVFILLILTLISIKIKTKNL